ncbi:MAG: PHP domain-containing protein, partial [Actinobacteria bacterium]|nr:PHP domain-containing protein [Actinomycetota bacterium]
MRELIDCHIHTGFCNHATGEPAAYVAAARAAGVSAMLFTEHAPLPEAFDPDRHLSICDADLEPYCATITTLAEENPDIEIGLGLE